MDKKTIIDRINKLKKEKNAVILVHNYQEPEMFEIADYVGDSLVLSKKVVEVDADIIVFCGVRFMAETAKILNPDKTVLLPNMEATCSMADMSNVEGLIKMKEKYPDAGVVCYINTNADVKAYSDIVCTSTNAVEITNSLPNREIIFLPDKNLAAYVQEKTDKKIIPYQAYCYVHNAFDGEILKDFKIKYPKAKVIAHPESPQLALKEADHICGTGGMAKYARNNEAKEFVIVTECGMTHRLSMEIPEKKFISFCNVCTYMKMTNLFLVERALTKMEYKIDVPKQIAKKAKIAIDRMINL